MDRIYLDNDHVVHLAGLTDDDGVAVTSATVEARVLDRNFQPVGGVSWPVTMSHVGNGDYEGVIDSSIVLTDRSLYYLEVTASYAGLDATWRIQHVSSQRT